MQCVYRFIPLIAYAYELFVSHVRNMRIAHNLFLDVSCGGCVWAMAFKNMNTNI